MNHDGYYKGQNARHIYLFCYGEATMLQSGKPAIFRQTYQQ